LFYPVVKILEGWQGHQTIAMLESKMPQPKKSLAERLEGRRLVGFVTAKNAASLSTADQTPRKTAISKAGLGKTGAVKTPPPPPT
jgi:hypothetical protein